MAAPPDISFLGRLYNLLPAFSSGRALVVYHRIGTCAVAALADASAVADTASALVRPRPVRTCSCAGGAVQSSSASGARHIDGCFHLRLAALRRLLLLLIVVPIEMLSHPFLGIRMS